MNARLILATDLKQGRSSLVVLSTRTLQSVATDLSSSLRHLNQGIIGRPFCRQNGSCEVSYLPRCTPGGHTISLLSIYALTPNRTDRADPILHRYYRARLLDSVELSFGRLEDWRSLRFMGRVPMRVHRMFRQATDLEIDGRSAWCNTMCLQ